MKIRKLVFGICLVIAGVLFLLQSFGVVDFSQLNIFFDGWWTLFIIVPCSVGLFEDKDKTGSIIGIVIGVLLLLCAQHIITYDNFWKIALAIVFVISGIKLIINSATNKED